MAAISLKHQAFEHGITNMATIQVHHTVAVAPARKAQLLFNSPFVQRLGVPEMTPTLLPPS